MQRKAGVDERVGCEKEKSENPAENLALSWWAATTGGRRFIIPGFWSAEVLGAGPQWVGFSTLVPKYLLPSVDLQLTVLGNPVWGMTDGYADGNHPLHETI